MRRKCGTMEPAFSPSRLFLFAGPAPALSQNREWVVRPMTRYVAGTLLVLATTLAWPVLASDYPNKPIKVISDSAPGSAVDVSFRMVMDRLCSVLGQQIVPIDQPGAGGAIAARAASESIPDGYTTVRAGAFFVHLASRQGRKPAADLAARFPSRRFAGT